MNTLLGKLALVAVGGGFGAVARYGLDAAIGIAFPTLAARFPIGIFLINALGCLGFGFICGLSGDLRYVSEFRRLLLLTGVLGGFTTFSTFGQDTARLLAEGSMMLAALNAVGSVVVSVAGIFLGLWLGQRWGGW